MYAIRHADTGEWWNGAEWVKARCDARWTAYGAAKAAIKRLRKSREPFPADTVELVSINA